MAFRHEDILSAGARVYGIVVDSPAQNSAMIEKLSLPFPILSDATRDAAIEPFGFSNPNDPRNLAYPGTVIVDTDATEAFRWMSRDFADRISEDEIIAEVAKLGRPTTTQAHPSLGKPEPGAKAMPFGDIGPYLRGAKFAAQALGLRHKDAYPDIKDDTKAYVAEMDRYLDAYTELKRSQT